ncbi:MAG: FKBP-type peptidyl-prolyl cis-trans isomerase [Bacteroidaceae bacterium]|nr:FKBP-type peptidyl-prolyl cis-trans isomerase [Bacteroidaceae bacterium]
MKTKIILTCCLLAGLSLTATAQRRGNRRASTQQSATAALDTIIKEKPVPADSFSTAAGIMLAPSLKAYATQNLSVDPAYMSDFIEGLRANVDEAYAKKMNAYNAGLTIGLQNKDNVIPGLNRSATGKADSSFVIIPLFVEGLVSGLSLNDQDATNAARATVERQMAYQNQVYHYANTRYLMENAGKEDVVTLPSGLQYRIIERGQGVVATDTNTVEVHYEGKLIDGTVFDSSYQRGKPAEFKPTQVIKGWTEALQMMPEGSTWELCIPYNLAYGEQGNRDIPPFSTLVFKVQVVKVK